MSRIIIVEDDPVVWMDLSELLTARFGEAALVRKTLPEVLLDLPSLADGRSTLILSDLPRPLDPLKQALDQGLRLVITNTIPPGDADALNRATIVGRPFETSALIEALM